MTFPGRPEKKQISDWLQAIAPAAHLYSDSRHIAEAGGDAVFVAYPGDEADGRDYIGHAISAGARAVIYEEAGFKWKPEWNVPHLAVTDLKIMAGVIAAVHYGQPDAGMYTVGVTGTNGKTSCTQWIASALSCGAEPSAVIGTLGVGVCRKGVCDRHETTGYTTPDAVLLQRLIAGLRAQGVTSLAIEASSIGLDQERLNGMHFDVALFTNFSRDHLDYHLDMAAYEAAKSRLFDWSGLRHAVINMDDPMGMRLVNRCRGKLALTGYAVDSCGAADIPMLRASWVRMLASGMEIQVESPFGTARVKTHLVGRFNVSNMLGVLGVLLAKGIAWNKAIDLIAQLNPVGGRMQRLGGADAPMVVIDYAHTPDALEKAIAALREVAEERKGSLWCVFGCGGDRDAGKRPLMGAAAEQADHVMVTSDNPRGEDPQQIFSHILQGMKTEPQVVEDRAAAILLAVKQAAKQDVILVAGKGHETYQEIMGVKLPFVDADHAALALAARATMMRGGV